MALGGRVALDSYTREQDALDHIHAAMDPWVLWRHSNDLRDTIGIPVMRDLKERWHAHD